MDSHPSPGMDLAISATRACRSTTTSPLSKCSLSSSSLELRVQSPHPPDANCFLFFGQGETVVRFWNSDSITFFTSQGRGDDFMSAHGHSVTLRATFWCTSANISGLYFCMILWLYWDKMCNNTSLAHGFIKVYSINRSPVFNLVLRCIVSHPGCLLAGWAQI